MPKGSRCFGSPATRIAINGSLGGENSGHVSSTVKYSQYECAVVERLEDDQVISVCAGRLRPRSVAIVLGDVYQRAVLGIVEEGDGEAFEQQIAAAIAYALSWRA
jgi:hypothetical protein